MTTITSLEGMRQAIEQMGRLYEGLRHEFEPVNPRNFATLAEGHLDEIRRLQRALDEYSGATAVDAVRGR